MNNSFQLDKAHAKIMGVCGGVANWAEIDITLVRVLWVLAALCTAGTPILLYVIIGLVAN